MKTNDVVTTKGKRLKTPQVEKFHVLMEFPWRPDCEFFAMWLLKVTEAEEFWFEVHQRESFAQNYPHLDAFPDPQLRAFALAVMSTLRHDQDRKMEDEYLFLEDEGFVYAIDFNFCKTRGFETEFLILKGLGFFTVFENFYRMEIPQSLSPVIVELVVVNVADNHLNEKSSVTANSPGILYMPKAEAEAKAAWWRAQ